MRIAAITASLLYRPRLLRILVAVLPIYGRPLNLGCVMSVKTFLIGVLRWLSVSAVVIAMSLSGRPLQAAENQPPAVNITNPKTGDSFPTGLEIPFMTTVTDRDGPVARIEFFVNGVRLWTCTNPVYATGVMWNTGGAGTYTLTATATDLSGATTTSSEVIVLVSADDLAKIEAADPAQAKLSRPDHAVLTRLPGDVLHFGVPGDDGRPYRVEVSEDLTHWTPVSDTVADGGRVVFVQPRVTGFKHRFYRVRPIMIEALDED